MNKTNIKIKKHIPYIHYYFSTPEDTSKGLMGVKHMPSDAVALFIMNKTADHSFYMKNTVLPLDIMFLNEKGIVVGILENMVPFDETGKSVGHKSCVVVEAKAGYVKKHNIIPWKTKFILPKTKNSISINTKTMKKYRKNKKHNNNRKYTIRHYKNKLKNKTRKHK